MRQRPSSCSQYWCFFTVFDRLFDLYSWSKLTSTRPSLPGSRNMLTLLTLTLIQLLPPFTRRLWRLQHRESTRLNSSHTMDSYALFCFKKKKIIIHHCTDRQ